MRAALLMLIAAAASACGGGAPRTVLLVTVDTLRSDHTGVFGYELDTTPELDRLAAGGAAFSRCISQHPETGPSISSLLTSRYPRETGMRENGAVLPEEFETLAGAFRDAGYRTGAFVSTYLLKPHASGLHRGFDTYDHEMTSSNLGHEAFERIAGETVSRAISWLEEERGPAFLWVHLYDPHGRYDPGEELARRFYRDSGRLDLDRSRIPPYQRFGASLDPDDYVARYDGEIFRADRALGRLCRAAGRDALVAVTADHGEGLGENDYWFRHGSLLDRSALRVPLVFSGPGVPAGLESDVLVQNLDVAPTLLDLAGIDPLPDARGHSLSPVLRGERIVAPTFVFSEARRMGGVADSTGVDTRYKVAATSRTGRMVMWPEDGAFTSTGVDSAAMTDLMGSAIRRFLAVGDRLPGEPAAGDVSDALRGLGYLEGRNR